jgi:8-hydroxy-5-deazaflavin:NADPH oxidoreductase
VAAALHHVPAKELGDLDQPIESDVLICSDHPRASEVTSEMVAKIPNMRPLHAGELAMATPIESFTAVLLQLNLHYKTRVAVKFTGITTGSAGDGVGTDDAAAAPASASTTASSSSSASSGRRAKGNNQG